MPARKFEDLIVWQKAHKFVLGVYLLSDNFPIKEVYSLTPQMRRAAISIAANIAEGFKKKSKRDKIRLFNIAQGSLEESRYYLILAKDLGYGDNKSIRALLEEVSKLLEAYISTIRQEVNHKEA